MNATAINPLQSPASETANQRNWLGWLVFGLVSAGLYQISRYNYLLFHSLLEVFSIVVAGSLFVVVWTSRHYSNNPYLLFIGIAYLFVGGIDLLHTLSYPGINIFPDYPFYANQLWIGARFLESISLFLAFLAGFSSRPFRSTTIFVGYSLGTGLLIASIFVWKIFPECFSSSGGLTPFKKNSEYLICAIILLDMGLLFHYRARFTKRIFRLLLWSMICTIISELAFTFYVNNYDFSNLVGHYFKLFSFWLIYLAIIETSIKEPYQLIFHDLSQANLQLREKVALLRQTEKELRTALNEVKNLSGLLPICASCKKIRDDQGYWNRLETYISKHSEAQFSHGYCPECYQKVLLEIDRRAKGNKGYPGE